MKISILVPCYNEVGTLGQVVASIEKVNLGAIEKEIILINDGSTDGTKELMEKQYKNRASFVVLNNEKNQGKGFALRLGFEKATGELIIIQDADLEVSPEEYPKLIEVLLAQRAKVVFGSRYLKNKRHKNRGVYDFGSHLINYFFNLVFGTQLTDVNTCHKLFYKACLPERFSSKGFDLDLELAASFVKGKHKIVEVPISYFPRDKATGKKLHWRDGFFFLWRILVFRFKK